MKKIYHSLKGFTLYAFFLLLCVKLVPAEAQQSLYFPLQESSYYLELSYELKRSLYEKMILRESMQLNSLPFSYEELKTCKKVEEYPSKAGVYFRIASKHPGEEISEYIDFKLIENHFYEVVREPSCKGRFCFYVMQDYEPADLKSISVRLNGEVLYSDPETGFFSVKDKKKKSNALLEISDGKHTDFHIIQFDGSTNVGMFKKVEVLSKRAVHSLSRAVKNIVNTYRYYHYNFYVEDYEIPYFMAKVFDPYYRDSEKEEEYLFSLLDSKKSLLISDKPVYRKGDTVRLAAFLFRALGDKAPITDTFNLRFSVPLAGQNYKRKEFWTLLQMHRPGVYTGEWVIPKDVKIRSEQEIRIFFDKVGYEIPYFSDFPRLGIYCEDYELPDRFMSCSFDEPKPKDYDSLWKEIKLSIRDIQERFVPGEGKLKIKIERDDDYRVDSKECMLYIPQLLFRYEASVNLNKEITVGIPDSIFSADGLKVKISIDLTDDKGKHHIREFKKSYTAHHETLQVESVNDSLFIQDKHPEVKTVMLRRLTLNGVSKKKVILPYAEKVPSNTHSYKISNGFYTKHFTELKNILPVSQRIIYDEKSNNYTLEIRNPKKLPVSVFRHNLHKKEFFLLETSSDTQNEFHFKLKGKKQEVVKISYPWRNKLQSTSFRLRDYKRRARLRVEVEPLIRPGDSTEIRISMQNAEGKPLPETNIALRSNNAKFEEKYEKEMATELSLWENAGLKRHRSEKIGSESAFLTSGKSKRKLTATDLALLSDSSNTALNFLMPEDSFFRIEKRAYLQEGCKLSLYAFKKTEPLKIFMVSDSLGAIHYFSGAEKGWEQSFSLKSGRHQLRVLTEDSILLELPEIRLEPRTEVFISFDAEKIKGKRTKQNGLFTDTDFERICQHYIVFRRETSKSFQLRNDMSEVIPQVMQKNDFAVKRTVGHKPWAVYHYDEHLENWDKVYHFHTSSRDSKIILKKRRLKFKTLEKQDLIATLFHDEFNVMQVLRKMGFTSSKPEQIFSEDDNVCSERIAVAFPEAVSEVLLRHETEGFFRMKVNNEDVVRIANVFSGKYGVTWITPEGKIYTDFFAIPKERKVFISSQKIGYNITKSEAFQTRKAMYPPDYIAVTGKVEETPGSGLPWLKVSVLSDPENKVYTDNEGEFLIFVPPFETLKFHLGGNTSQTFTIKDSDIKLHIYRSLQPHEHKVAVGPVIFGQINMMKKEFTGVTASVYAEAIDKAPVLSVDQALQGQAAGVQVVASSGLPGGGISVMVRGQTSVASSDEASKKLFGLGGNAKVEKQPILYLKGLRVPLSFLKKMQLWPLQSGQPVTFVPPAEALGLYGEEASEGAFLFETERYTEAQILKLLRGVPLGEKKGFIRSDFRDVAVWAPTLQTDENGEARLRVKFPDNITRWRTEAWAVHPDRWNGHRKIYIDARLEQSAQLFTPRFLVRSDSIMLHGKCENYATDTLSLQTRFRAEEKILKEQSDTLRDFFSHYAPLSVPEKEIHFSDSLTLEFAAFENGQVADGERREVPLMSKGLLRREGSFVFAERDTSFTLSADKGDLQLNFGNGYRDLIRSEFHYFESYKHKCNEQLSSMLSAYLLQKQAYELSGKKFSHDKRIFKVVEELEKRQNDDGGWGFWPKEESNSFSTTYVLKALKYFSENYEDKKPVTTFEKGFSFLETSLAEKWAGDTERLRNIIFLLENQPSARLCESALAMIDSLPFGESRIYESLLQLRVSQLCGRDVSTIFLEKTRLESAEGAYFWRDRGYYRFTKSEIILTSLALDIASSDSLMKSWVPKIKSYFLQLMRNPEGLRNTYEKALVLRTLYEGGKSKGGEIRLNDKPVSKDGYSIRLSKGEKVKIYLPAGTFLSAFREFREEPDTALAHPVFSLKTYWPESDTLQVGSRIELTAEIEVFREAEFTVLEIPIPAACAFTEDRPAFESGEAYREYRRDRVLIYYNTMPVGLKRIRIPLDVKFAGRFIQNPALLESMYEPTMQAFEKMKNVLAEEDND